MQKSGLMLVVSGVLIVIGLILLVLGNQIVLEGVSQRNGFVNATQSLTVSGNFNIQETSVGVYATQLMSFKDNAFSVRIVDPNNNEIIYETISEETIENQFKITENGDYKLIIESIGNEESQVFGAVGPLPDAGKKSLGFISIYVLVVGMIGLIGAGIYEVKNRRRSV